MNNIQRAKLDACNRIKEYNTKHATSLKTITEYATEQAAFDNAYTNISNAVQIQSATVAVSTSAVEKAKQTMANTVIQYALRATVKAKQLANLTLANNLNHPVTYILRTTKTLAIQRAKDIKKHLNDNLTTLTNITTANITEITNAINAYDTIKDYPTIDIQAKKATGTNPLPTNFATAFAAIDNMYNLIVSYFLHTNPALVNEFALAKQIINTGIHHSGIEGIVTQNGNPVMGATINITGTNKTTTTDKEGHYIIPKVKAGDYTIQANITEKDTATKTAHISQGNFETLDFHF